MMGVSAHQAAAHGLRSSASLSAGWRRLHRTVQNHGRRRGYRSGPAVGAAPFVFARRKAHVGGDGAELFNPDAGGFSGVREYAARKSAPAAFPFLDKFRFRGWEGPVDAETVIRTLEPIVGEERQAAMDRVCANRSFNVLPIVEGSVNYGNLSAICRTSEALGCGAIHAILTGGKMKRSFSTSKGAEKWLDVRRWYSTADCIEHAKAAGYQVVVTHLREDAVGIHEVDWSKPTAVILGNEEKGVSEEAVAAADVCAVIPMDGFMESFNISVAAALVMYEARASRLRLLGAHGDLSGEEQRVLKAIMLLRHQRSTLGRKMDIDNYMVDLMRRREAAAAAAAATAAPL
eukprot:jgi/Tetstr1/460437/TSEL_005696.t1